MGRMYCVSFEGISVSAVQDLLEVQTHDDKVIVLHEAHCSQDDTDTGEQLRASIVRATAGYTSGSGGGTATVEKRDAGDADDSLLAHERNNTTQVAAGTGALERIFSRGFNSLAGFDYLPTPETRPVVGGGGAFVFDLDVAPSSAITMSGYMWLEEIG